jgi:hypothetical protein
MSHVRRQIRDAVADALDDLGGVYKSRLYPIQAAELPVYLVYSGDEEIEGQFDSIERTFDVVIEVVADGEGFDDTLDDSLAAIETRLNGTLSGLVISFTPVQVTATGSMEGSKPIGRLRVTYEAVYRTSHTNPAISI